MGFPSSRAAVMAASIASAAAGAVTFPQPARAQSATALSFQYGDYTRPGNIAGGQTVRIQTPRGEIECVGGTNRQYTGRRGPTGAPTSGGSRECHFVGR
jgi:hypothetical protein